MKPIHNAKRQTQWQVTRDNENDGIYLYVWVSGVPVRLDLNEWDAEDLARGLSRVASGRIDYAEGKD